MLAPRTQHHAIVHQAVPNLGGVSVPCFICALHYLFVSCLLSFSPVSRALYDKRISQEVEGEALGDEFAGYVSNSCVLRYSQQFVGVW